MSTQRLARASRSRFFIGLGILILTVGFVAIFHSSQQQIDELRQLELQCEQQQEALSQQVQIFEKSIKSERLEHQQTKFDLQRRSKEVKEFRDKNIMESNMKFGALQQNYKLLKSQNDDLTDEGEKLRAIHLKEIAGWESKLKNAATISAQQLKQRDRDLEELKVQHKMLNEKYKQLKEGDDKITLEQQLAQYREHCTWRPPNTLAENPAVTAAVHGNHKPNNFNAQIPVSANVFKIALSNLTNSGTSSNNATSSGGGTTPSNRIDSAHEVNTKGMKSTSAAMLVDRIEGIVNQEPVVGRSVTVLITNSVENFQMIPKALVGTSGKFDKSTTVSSAGIRAAKSLKGSASAELVNDPLPTALRLSSVSGTVTTTGSPKKSRPVPEGVVPVPPNEMLPEPDQPDVLKTDTPKVDTADDQTNNRYANVVDEVQVAPDAPVDDPKPNNEDNEAEVPPVSDVDNGAREVLDNNDFLVEGHKDHLQDVLDDVKLNSNNNNNAAEDDANGLDGQKDQRHLEERDNQNDEDNAILNGVGNMDGDSVAKSLKRHNKLANDPKLMHELVGDDGKVAGYPDDMHMEEANNEEEGDDDDYDNPAVKKMDPAVRN